MAVRFSVLASGSTGNAFYIESGQDKLLVDAGLSGKQLDRLFQEAGVDPAQLTGILVTHEHSDHIKGLGIIARKYNLPIYANTKTWHAMEKQLGKLTTDQKFHFEPNTIQTIDSIDVESCSYSHDAPDPMLLKFRASK